MPAPLYAREAIEAILPHRHPFLFVDRVMHLTPAQRITAELDLRRDAPWFAGHFPGHPMMPGVLVSEAMAQTAGLLVALSAKTGQPVTPVTPDFMVLTAVNIKFLRPALPGECLTLGATFERALGPLYHFTATARAGRQDVAAGTLVLTARKGPA